jgi:hypothetical protein
MPFIYLQIYIYRTLEMSLIYQAPAFSGGGPRPGLYLGGKADAKDRDKLDRWNVTHILNVTPPKQAGIQVNTF